MGMVLLLYSSMAISSGSIRVVVISKGAPIDICRALAPIILARSYRVYVCVCILRPQNDNFFNVTMGSLRFELRSLRPERNRMVQATLRPLGLMSIYWYGLSSSMISLWVRSIRLQQYREILRSSRIFLGSSPFSRLSLNSSHAVEIGFPQVKHRTGITIFYLSSYLLS